MTSRGSLPVRPDLLRWALVGLLLLTIGRVHQFFGLLGQLKPALVFVVLAGAYALLNPATIELNNVRRYWPPKVMLGLLLLAAVGAAFGLSLGGSAAFILQVYVKVIILAGLLVVSLRGSHDLKLYIWAFVIGVGFLIFLSVFVFDVSSTGGGVARLNDLYTYDANDMGLLMVVGLPLCLLLFQGSSALGKLFLGALMLGIGLAVALSGSRGAFVGLLAVGVALLVWVRRVALWKRVAAVAMVVMGLVIMAPTGYWDQMSTITEPTEDYNWTAPYGRKAIAERGLGYMLSNPVFGVGVDNFGRAEATISEHAESFRVLGRGVRWTAPHNSYVQVGAEMGIPGLSLWCILVFGGIVGMRRLGSRLPDSWREGDAEQRFLHASTVYLPVAFLGFAVTSFFLSFAYMDPIYILASFATGVYVSVDRRLTLESASSTRVPSGRPKVYRPAVGRTAGAGRMRTSRRSGRPSR